MFRTLCWLNVGFWFGAASHGGGPLTLAAGATWLASAVLWTFVLGDDVESNSRA